MAFSVIAVMIYLEPVKSALRMGTAVVESRKLTITNRTMRESRQGEEAKNDGDDDDGFTTEEWGKKWQSKVEAGSRRKVGTFVRIGSPLQGGVSVSAGHQSLKNKKKRQLVGLVLILVGSTLLLVNVMAFLVFPDKLKDTPLNVHLVGFNVESILFNVGILFVCGIGSQKTTNGSQKSNGVVPSPTMKNIAFLANSQASSVYSPSEVEIDQRSIPPAATTQTTDKKKIGLLLPPIAEAGAQRNKSDEVAGQGI